MLQSVRCGSRELSKGQQDFNGHNDYDDDMEATTPIGSKLLLYGSFLQKIIYNVVNQ
jgi:hypothetical protein